MSIYCGVLEGRVENHNKKNLAWGSKDFGEHDPPASHFVSNFPMQQLHEWLKQGENRGTTQWMLPLWTAIGVCHLISELPCVFSFLVLVLNIRLATGCISLLQNTSTFLVQPFTNKAQSPPPQFGPCQGVSSSPHPGCIEEQIQNKSWGIRELLSKATWSASLVLSRICSTAWKVVRTTQRDGPPAGCRPCQAPGAGAEGCFGGKFLPFHPNLPRPCSLTSSDSVGLGYGQG